MARKKGRRSKPHSLNLKQDTVSSILALVIIGLGGLVAISFTQQGPVLKAVYKLGSYLIGWLLLVVPFLFVAGGLSLTKVKWQIAKPTSFFGSLITVLSLAGLSQAGVVGNSTFDSVAGLITPYGAALLFFIGVSIGQFIFWESSFEDISSFFANLSKPKNVNKDQLLVEGEVKKKGGLFKAPSFGFKGMGVSADKAQDTLKIFNPTGNKDKDGGEDEIIVPNTSMLSPESPIIWNNPPLTLLSDGKHTPADPGDFHKNKDIIEKTLASFGIGSTVKEVHVGPTVTQYAIELVEGTKVSKIINLQNDLALALSAPQGQIRVEAPIPGRNLVGVEVPNRSFAKVTLRKMLTSDIMRNASKTTVALGLNVAGEPTVADISKMPHVLIAGSTGSGKSVAINAFIASILFRSSPQEVKFILVDPKRVELTGYNNIPHLITPVITDPNKVVNALKWAVDEMNSRYKLLSEVGARNITSFNERQGIQALPYIVIIIDELADIMLAAPREVEEYITRLAQMARAVGIHLVLATQRPSVDIITGLIKANIPCRIAFNVASQIDSRVILDGPGAEKLLGKGDMLFVPPDDSKPRRIQGTFVEDGEIESLVNYLRNSGINPEYNEDVVADRSHKGNPNAGLGDSDGSDNDEFFDQAIQLCIDSGKASASLLQRRLSIGYARAARIMDQLTSAGIVAASDGTSKPREVIIKSVEEYYASKNKS
jgi:DNA segregation ATPase FtsK/SpoIIIE, S-DNA-T family